MKEKLAVYQWSITPKIKAFRFTHTLQCRNFAKNLTFKPRKLMMHLPFIYPYIKYMDFFQILGCIFFCVKLYKHSLNWHLVNTSIFLYFCWSLTVTTTARWHVFVPENQKTETKACKNFYIFIFWSSVSIFFTHMVLFFIIRIIFIFSDFFLIFFLTNMGELCQNFFV